MNAHALLTSQGWRGTGNSLHPTSNNVGLSRPLLVSRKDNVLGVGKKQHKTSDMWWMNAFDSSLKGLDTSKQGTVIQTVTSGGLDMFKKGGSKFVGTAAGGGLYASFVRGEPLSGTITPDEKTAIISLEGSGEEKPKMEKRRKSERAEKETKEERRARKTAKRAVRLRETIIKLPKQPKKAEKEVEEEKMEKTEIKAERREQRRLKRLAKQAKEKYAQESSEKSKKKE